MSRSSTTHARLSGVTILSALSLASAAATAQTATPLPPVQVETLGDMTAAPDDATVLGPQRYTRIPGTSDTTDLLRGIPGVNLITGGGVSALPDIHGLGDDRVKTSVDGMEVTSACPNHMNPALSYIDPSRVGTLEVWSGITPVSVGGDSIGGTIVVKSAPPVFAAPGEALHTEGSLSTFYRSVNDGIGGAAALTAATDTYSLGYSGSWVKGRDYYAGGDHSAVHSTLYDSRNHALTLAAQHEGQLVALQGGQQFIPYEGFANQRMDLTGNRGRFLNSRYEGQFDWGKIEAKAFWQFVQHEMNILQSERTGNMPMNTKGTDLGYEVKAEIPFATTHTLRVGNELHMQRLEDWWPSVGSGMMSPNAFTNIHDGQRDRIGTFIEWENKWAPQWTTLVGARNDTVMMDTGMVNAYSSGGMNATDARTAAAFNARDRARVDYNFDMTAQIRYEPDATSTNELGYSRKTRSPNLYERYAWSIQSMDSSMNNWFGDANSYVGDPDLKPEVAHTVSLSAALHDPTSKDWTAKVTPYYSYIVDYIGVTKAGDFTATNGSLFPLLKIANHDAMMYGVDFSGGAGLYTDPAYGNVRLSGVLGWVHGETVNTGRSLYHMMPVNAKATVEHRLGGWTSAVELALVGAKTETDTVRNEPKTPGYALINLRSGYEWENIQLNLGIDNLFDKRYYNPLGGVDMADWRSSAEKGQVGPLPAPGRSFNAGVTVKF